MKTRTRIYTRVKKSSETKRHHHHTQSRKKISLVYVYKKPPPRPIKDDELMYEVKTVMGARMGAYGPEYLVRWKGYGQHENTWISELPPFFKKRCLKLVQKIEVSDSVASDSSYTGSESDSGSDSESDSVSGPDDSSDSESDESSDSESGSSSSSDDSE
ncbi:hypothetical protein T484DRAFT_1756575 [Baffinella frigidus]|nr:hypothetical protein T484DRAFT_1756575 [Cryptophyta sp. CCMP2293]